MKRFFLTLMLLLAAGQAKAQTVISYTGASLSCTGTSTAVLTFTTTGGNQGFTISGGTISGCNYLIVGGGGGGGGASADASGGGGGGGVLAVTGTPLSSGQYIVTIGVGGSGGTAGSNPGSTGGTSSFNGFNVGGGGGGGSSSPIKAATAGTALNGSGGGAGGNTTSGTNAGGGVGTGHGGGLKYGGGGGWGSTGGSGGTQNGAVIGGTGYATTLFSSFGSLQVGGGGGSGGDAGQYGGGSGTLNGFSLLATYGGGGAGGWSASTTSGGSGGNGIVCVSFPYSACSGLFGAGGGGATVVFSGSPAGTLTSGTVNVTGGTTGWGGTSGTLNLPSAANVLTTAALGFSGSGSYTAIPATAYYGTYNSTNGSITGAYNNGSLLTTGGSAVLSGVSFASGAGTSSGGLNLTATGQLSLVSSSSATGTLISGTNAGFTTNNLLTGGSATIGGGLFNGAYSAPAAGNVYGIYGNLSPASSFSLTGDSSYNVTGTWTLSTSSYNGKPIWTSGSNYCYWLTSGWQIDVGHWTNALPTPGWPFSSNGTNFAGTYFSSPVYWTASPALIPSQTVGTLALPDGGLVRNGFAYGVSGTGSTGVLNVSTTADSDPGVNNVLLGTSYSFAAGAGGPNRSGSYSVPSGAYIKGGVRYGVAGSLSGSYSGAGFNSDPGQANVLIGTPYQILGTAITGSLTTTGSGAIAVSPSDVWNGVPFTTSSGTTTGVLTIDPNNVRYGQIIHGSTLLNSVTGACPVPGPYRSTAPKPQAPSPKPQAPNSKSQPPKPHAAIIHRRGLVRKEKK